jgi:hypothetical protein
LQSWRVEAGYPGCAIISRFFTTAVALIGFFDATIGAIGAIRFRGVIRNEGRTRAIDVTMVVCERSRGVRWTVGLALVRLTEVEMAVRIFAVKIV